jgi:hypothetical protein
MLHVIRLNSFLNELLESLEFYIQFSNLSGFSTYQKGAAGDITASRKVKVPECSMEELMECFAASREFPWHWGNSLYLEWFSETNGRVVIETAHYQLEMDGEPAWAMTEQEEAGQRSKKSEAMMHFMERLGGAAGAAPTDKDAHQCQRQTGGNPRPHPRCAGKPGNGRR